MKIRDLLNMTTPKLNINILKKYVSKKINKKKLYFFRNL